MPGSIYATMKTRTLRYIALYTWSLCLLTLAVTDPITMCGLYIVLSLRLTVNQSQTVRLLSKKKLEISTFLFLIGRKLN